MVLRTITAVAVLLFASAGCKKSPEKQFAGFMTAGDRSLQQKQYARALLNFRAAARIKPASAEPEYRIGVTYLEMLDAQSAATHLWAAAKLDPKHVPAQVKLAELLALNDNLDLVRDAEQRARAAVDIAPANTDAINALAVSEFRLGQEAEAERRLRDTLAASPGELKTAMNLAEFYIARNELSQAEAVLKNAADRKPRNPVAFTALARFYRKTGRADDAAKALSEALSIDPRNASALSEAADLNESGVHLKEAEDYYIRVSNLGDARLGTEYARFLLRHDRAQDAAAELQRRYAAAPGNRDVRTLLVNVLLNSGRNEAARNVLDKALASNGADAGALVQRGTLYCLAGKPKEAERDARTAISYYPDSGSAHYLLAKVHALREEPLKRRQELNEAVRLDPALLAARIDLTRDLIAAGSIDPARRVIDGAPEAQQELLPYIAVRNEVLLAAGEQEQARKGIQKGLAKARVPELLLQDSLWRLNAKQYESARQSAEEALRLSPDSVKALNSVVLVLLRQGQGAAALRRVKEHVAQHADSSDLQYFLGQFLESAGDRAGAIGAYTAALKARPDFTPAVIASSRLEMIEGKTSAAREGLERAAASDPRSWEARLLLGNLHKNAGEYAQAVNYYRAALGIAPGNALVANALAYILAEHESNLDEALKYAQQAVESAPKAAMCHDTLGWIYYRKGLYGSAIEELKLAVETEPNALRRYHLAIAFFKSGDAAQGERQYQAAVTADPRLPEAQLAQQLRGRATNP